MQVPFNFLKQEIASEKNIILNLLNSVIDSGIYILGENVKNLENRLMNYLGVKYVVTVNSGTDALILSLRAANIKQGEEIITVSNTFIATIEAIVAVGAKPVYVDIDDDMLMDPKKIEKKITKKTKAIIPVHLTGRPAAMNDINIIAKKYNLLVIDDAAQSFGATYFKKLFFDSIATCYSFHPYKVFHCLGDGGAIATNNEDLYNILIKLRNHGICRNSIYCFGYNSRLDEMQSAILLSLISLLEMKLKKRRIIARKYIDSLKDLVDVPDWNKKIMDPTFQTFVIKTERREELAAFLKNNGIETRIHYPIPCHQQKIAVSSNTFHLPKTEEQAKKILSLPIAHLLTVEQQNYIIEIIRRFYYGTRSFH